MKTFRETYPDKTVDDEHLIQEFVSQPEVLEIILNIQQLRSHIINLICEKIQREGCVKQSPDFEIYKIRHHRKAFTVLNGLLIELFDTVLPPLLSEKSLVQCFVDKTDSENKNTRKKSKLNTLFSVSVIGDTELTSLIDKIIEMSYINSLEPVNEFDKKRITSINRKIYNDLKKLRSEIITL
jgi:hypothetical protein